MTTNVTLRYMDGAVPVKVGTPRQIAKELRQLANDPHGPTVAMLVDAFEHGHEVTVGPYSAKVEK